MIIVGAGPSGIFAAYELITLDPKLKVLMIEKGNSIEKRNCPIASKKKTSCSCSLCSVMSGWGGAGAFSDGKLTYSNVIGGNLSQQVIEDCMKYVSDVYESFGATDSYYDPSDSAIDELSRKAYINNLKLFPFKIKHMGTECSYEVLKAMQEDIIGRGVEVKFMDEVEEILFDTNTVKGVRTHLSHYMANCVILAPGREGSGWLVNEMKKRHVTSTRNYVDIGVRMEIPASVMSDITTQFYELKLEYYSKTFNDRVRTFCMCPYGEVIIENYGGLMTVNGHSYYKKKTANTNFAILVSTNFTEPFDKPLDYAKSITSLSNMLSNGVIVQTLGDLKRGRRSTVNRMKKGFVEPTLTAAIPGDISFVLPYRHLKNIMEMIDAMDKMIPGVGSEHNLLYAVEAKFYSAKIDTDDNYMTSVDGLYAIGDGAGLTRGLMQASISGTWVARQILSKMGGEL